MTLVLKGEFLLADIKKIYHGNTEVDKLYCGTDLVHEKEPADTTAPTTTVYPDPSVTYPAGEKVWLEVDEACDTYYTLDGSTPTTNSTLFTEAFTLDTTTTIKYFSVDTAGNTEAVKSTVFNIEEASTGWRYVRFIGHGDNTNSATTRLVEYKAMEGTTNRLLNKTPIEGEAVDTGGSIDAATNGVTDMSESYPIWWTAEGVPTLVYDLGSSYPIDTLQLWMYSTAGDPRQTRFILAVSNDNANWTTIVDNSTNTTVQPSEGWAFAI
jgi:hypothetical protein